MTSQVWQDDPRRLGFVLARYKFAAKMLSGLERVLEIGCADAFGTRVVAQEVGSVAAIDFDPVFIEDAISRSNSLWPVEVFQHDITDSPVDGPFDAAYSIDVLEHIPKEKENDFVANVAASLSSSGVFLVGSPSIHSQAYASEPSKQGHVNCKDAVELKTLLQRYFSNVFIFSMNDEVVHTGFSAMAHYLFGLACGPKSLTPQQAQ